MSEELDKPMNLPAGFWYEIWSQVIASAWSGLYELRNETKLQILSIPQWLRDETNSPMLSNLISAGRINPRLVDVLRDLPTQSGEAARRQIDWAFLQRHNFVADTGEEPLNFPELFVELVEEGDQDPAARYMAKNAFRNINGWAQDLIELGGQATIKVPVAPTDLRVRAKALDWYVKQGFHMPFAPNNSGPFSPGKNALNASSALGFSGGRVGEESASQALDCDAAWFGVFPQILAAAWNDREYCDRLTQPQARRALCSGDTNRETEARIRRSMLRERDALFAEFGYSRPIGLDVDFKLVEAAYDEASGWDKEALRPTLVIRIPPPPSDLGLHPIALADYRATGRAQLFTT